MNPIPEIHVTGASTSEDPGLFLPTTSVVLHATIERVLHHDADEGLCILEVKREGRREPFLLSGRLVPVHPGQSLEASLSLTPSQLQTLNDPELPSPGALPCFRLKAALPESARGLRKFLKSGALGDIGPNLAAAIVKELGTDFFDCLENDPARLRGVAGVGIKRQKSILSAWNDWKERREVADFLFERNMPLAWAALLQAKFGADGLKNLLERPYETALECRLDFATVDAFALKIGHPFHSQERAVCALHDFLWSFYRHGHCACPETQLLDEVFRMTEIRRDFLEEVLELELLNETLIAGIIGETPCIFLKPVWNLENEVAERLLSFDGKEPPWGWFNPQKVVNWAEGLMNVRLAPLQKEAIETALSSSLTVITGGPGTGKTTLIRALVTILQTQFSKFALCSPTGRAAQRLEEATGAPAKTLHRLLKYDGMTGRFGHRRDNPLDLDLILVDEASMVDLELMAHLLDALPEHCSLILVGDADQIPSIGAGNVLQSVISSERFPTVKLTDIFRQRHQSSIKLNSRRINEGQMPFARADDQEFHYLPVQGTVEMKRTIQDLVTKVIPERYGISDSRHVQILVPLNRGDLGTKKLNDDLQRRLNGHQRGVQGFTENFRPGDKVMVVKNDYKKEVFNGDIGLVHRIDPVELGIEVRFENRDLFFRFDELDQLTLAYAISVHKSQGSEYRAVIVVVASEHLPMAQRHLIYTAVTRGKEHVFLVAEPSALQAAILSDESSRRWQRLTGLLVRSA